MNYPAAHYMSEDRWAHERAILRYMLTAQTAEGLPIVCGEVLLLELAEDLLAGDCHCAATAEGIRAWALSDQDSCCGSMYNLSCKIGQSYGVMVGAISYGYHPDWLCLPPSPALGEPSIHAWDRFGRRVILTANDCQPRPKP